MHQKRKRSGQSVAGRIVHVVAEMMFNNIRTQSVKKVEWCFIRAEIKYSFFGEFELLYNRRKTFLVSFHSKEGKDDGGMERKGEGSLPCCVVGVLLCRY